MAKLLASEASWEAANACLDTHGGYGFVGVRRRAEVPGDAAVPGRARGEHLILAYLAEHVLGLPRSF